MADTNFSFVVETIENIAVFHLTGEFVLYALHDNRDVLENLRERLKTQAISADCIIDLKKVTNIDANGLGILIVGLKSSLDNQHKISISGPKSKVMRTFKMTGLHRTFEIFDTVNNALVVMDSDGTA